MLRALFALLLALGMAAGLQAQGCSQCRDTVAQTNPAQQQSYRQAIEILLTGAVAVAGASFVVIRRFGR